MQPLLGGPDMDHGVTFGRDSDRGVTCFDFDATCNPQNPRRIARGRPLLGFALRYSLTNS
jgi:hypothetical protein